MVDEPSIDKDFSSKQDENEDGPGVCRMEENINALSLKQSGPNQLNGVLLKQFGVGDLSKEKKNNTIH